MRNSEIVVFSGNEVSALLNGREPEILDVIQRAYQAHEEGRSSLPQSVFLQFPDNDSNRIIGLPAYLGGDFNVAGFKWIASFPQNIEKGIDRASAITVLNSLTTGRPEFLFEGSVISAKRTAASAALAAKVLIADHGPESLGLMGCGLINFEICRFLFSLYRHIPRILAYDISADRARQFQRRCREVFAADVELAVNGDMLFRQCDLVSLATTARKPHIHRLEESVPGGVILHVSLRDLAPEMILNSENIVDDVEHVCRAETSIHLAEQLTGRRDFIAGTLAGLLAGNVRTANREKTTIFSPFGLGVLDLALAALVRDLGVESGAGTSIPDFFPQAWSRATEWNCSPSVCV